MTFRAVCGLFDDGRRHITATPATDASRPADTWLAGRRQCTHRWVGAGFGWACGRSLHRCSPRCAETVATRPAPLAGSLRQGSLRSLWTQGDWSSALLQQPWPPGTADDTRGQAVSKYLSKGKLDSDTSPVAHSGVQPLSLSQWQILVHL